MRKMNRSPLLRAGMTVAVALAACIAATGQDVHHNSMPGVDFSKFHTYKWVDIEGGAHPNQIVDAEIKQLVDSQLASKGMTETDNDKADLYVGYQIAVDKEKKMECLVHRSRLRGRDGIGHPVDHQRGEFCPRYV